MNATKVLTAPWTLACGSLTCGTAVAATTNATIGDAEAKVMAFAVATVAVVAVSALSILTYMLRRILRAVDRIPSEEWFASRDQDHELLRTLATEHNLLHKRCLIPQEEPGL